MVVNKLTTYEYYVHMNYELVIKVCYDRCTPTTGFLMKNLDNILLLSEWGKISNISGPSKEALNDLNAEQKYFSVAPCSLKEDKNGTDLIGYRVDFISFA